jgi:hypothetical protein
VWWCAEQVYPGLVDCYAVLGNDIVIADKAVANVYTSALEKGGLSISEKKDLIL